MVVFVRMEALKIFAYSVVQCPGYVNLGHDESALFR
jgi:hypothetical protein